MARPTYRQVSKLLAYDPRTGRLTWRVSRGGCFAGDLAGGTVVKVTGFAYRLVHICGHRTYAPRAVWLLMTGRWPKRDVAARDGNLLNLRWTNLYLQDNRSRVLRAKIRKDNTSGTKGVSYHVLRRRWTARAWDNGQIFLGSFPSKQEAEDARKRHSG